MGLGQCHRCGSKLRKVPTSMLLNSLVIVSKILLVNILLKAPASICIDNCDEHPSAHSGEGADETRPAVLSTDDIYWRPV